MTLDTFGCIGSTIKTAGGYLDLANPDPALISIETIASALSKICRYGGHCPRFYSVTEHCIHAVGIAITDGGWGDNALRSIFLHDAAEAFIGDVVKPLKNLLADYREIEARMEQAIETRFKLNFKKFGDVVKRYDREMLKAEKMHFWPDDKEQWEGFGDSEPRVVHFQFFEPSMAEQQFLWMAGTFGL